MVLNSLAKLNLKI